MWHSVNYTEMNTQGLEVSAGLSFDKIVKDVRLSYSLLHSDKETGYYISKYALDYLKNKLTLSTQLALTKKLTLGVVGAYWERNGSYYDKDNILTPYDHSSRCRASSLSFRLSSSRASLRRDMTSLSSASFEGLRR